MRKIDSQGCDVTKVNRKHDSVIVIGHEASIIQSKNAFRISATLPSFQTNLRHISQLQQESSNGFS